MAETEDEVTAMQRRGRSNTAGVACGCFAVWESNLTWTALTPGRGCLDPAQEGRNPVLQELVMVGGHYSLDGSLHR